ncbi:hypothetical protein PAMP_011909 [Pampus punctatissimus]
MEDFEYSVEISDRDWDCFFKECEECNLLPPSLAGVDDSGMSDIDDTGSILAKRAQKVDLTAGLSEADCPIDGPPDCEGSPVEHFLSKHGIGGMESVLSGSEEDIHLQSVNIFFERMKNLTEAEKLPEPSQIKAGKNREAIQEEELCSDGKRASSSTLPKNIPKLNSLPVRGETAGGKETTEPVNTIRNINTMKKVQPGSKTLHEPAASNSVLKTNMSTSTETQLFIEEEACTETRANEETLQNQSPDTPVCSETSPNANKVIKVKMCMLFDDVKREDMSSGQCKTDSQHNLEILSNVKWKEEQNPHFLHSNTTYTNKATSQESSPSASIKRKRRKKRQLSTDPAESGNRYDRQSESGEEEYAWRGGRALCLSEDIDLFYLNKSQKNVMSTSSSVTNNFPGMISGNEIKANLSHSIPPCDSQCPSTETANSERRYVHAGSLRQSDKKSHNLIIGCENEQNLKCCQAEVESITHSILLSADSYDRAVEVIQNDKQSTAKTVLAAEAGNSGRDNHTLCQSKAEPQQQLEIECNNKDRYSCTLGKTHLPLSETGGISSDVLKLPAHNIKSQTEILTQVSCAKLTSDCINSLSDKSCLCKSLSSLAINTSVQETEHPLETLSKLDVLPESANLAEVMVVYSGNSFSSGEMNLPGNSHHRETNLDTESVMSLSHENSTGMFVSSCSSVSQNNSEGQGEKTPSILATNGEDEEDATSGPKGQTISHETAGSKCDLVFRAEDAFTASKDERETKNAPDSKHSVFAMSSFWNEMEKLTINDILGLRMNSKTAPASSLTPSEESEESDMFTMTDSGFFTQQEPEQTGKDMFINPNSSESNSGSVTALDSTSLRDVMWESEPVPVSLAADIYPETMKLTSVSDVSQPGFSRSAQKYLRKISKNVSVHDLHALESEACSNAWKGQTLQTLDEGESEKLEFFTEGYMPKQDKATNCLPSSSIENYRISLTDIFQYIFGQKQPVPSQSATDNINTCYTDGDSVPETYDHFFSEFDTESFFCPLITAEDQNELAPIFSCSRSKNRNLQFPEAYDYFFASSSSDDSSVESDEEESCSPVRVVTRFTRKTSTAQISTDIYENFFTDSDIKQNFFWKNTFSFRNFNFTGATVQKQTSSSPLSLVPMRQSGRSLQRTICPVNALGNQDMTYPDLLLYHLEDRISRQLAQQPFRHEDLQTAVSNPSESKLYKVNIDDDLV